MQDIEDILAFIIEIEKLKNVFRKTKPVGLNRFENSAEHSWHVCLLAMLLKDYANYKVDIFRVIKMLLIHDLGEIDAGDKIIYESETTEQKNSEAEGVERLFRLLPDGKFNELKDLWYEFEEGISIDSKFARAIDRIPPILHNLHGNGHSWKTHNISKDKVFAVNQRIDEGSSQTWDVIKAKLEQAVKDGLLKE